MSKRILASGIVVVLAALVASLSASAAFPGKNGKIVFGSEQAGEDEIWIMNADGSDRHNLTRHDGAKISDIDPRWSPDGRQIVFASDPNGSRQIWLMNANGSSPRALTSLPGRNRYPSFTADGKQIVFQSLVGGNFEIYRMNADGSEVTNLTNDPGVDWAPATSPRGKKIVFTRERDNDGDLFIWSPDKPLVRLTNTDGYDYYANWSPNGNDLVFVREDSSGGTDLYLAHSDGTGERQLTFSPSLPEYFPAFSPEGTKVAFSVCGPPKPPGAPNPVCSTHVMNLDRSGDVDLAYPTPVTELPFTDDFDDNLRNVDYWSLIHDGTGGTVAERDGRVEFTLASDAAPSSGQFPAIRVSYDFKCIMNADFDAQVDYELLDWPEANGAVVQLQSFYADANVARQSQGWGESYAAFVPPNFSSIETAHQSGTLRLVRIGSKFTGYYKEGVDWVPILEASGSQGQALLVLGLASYDSFAGEQVRVAFDNFRVDAEDIDCSSSRPDFHPDWQPVGK